MSNAKIPVRKELKEQDKWKLDALFAFEQEYEELFSKVEKKLNSYSEFKGKIALSVLDLNFGF